MEHRGILIGYTVNVRDHLPQLAANKTRGHVLMVILIGYTVNVRDHLPQLVGNKTRGHVLMVILIHRVLQASL